VGIKRATGVERVMRCQDFVDLIQLASKIEERKLQLQQKGRKKVRKQLDDKT